MFGVGALNAQGMSAQCSPSCTSSGKAADAGLLGFFISCRLSCSVSIIASFTTLDVPLKASSKKYDKLSNLNCTTPGQRFVPGPASCSGRHSLPRAAQGLARNTQRSHRYSRAQRRRVHQQAVQTVLSAEGLNGPPNQGQTELAEDGWISRTLAAFRTGGADNQGVPAP